MNLIKKMNFKNLIFVLAMFLLSASSCASKKMAETTLVIKKADESTVSVKVEIAKTESERAYGFMNRKKIPDGTGMIFIFEYDMILTFWMKNTPTALSIAYIDKNGIIRDIFDMTPFSLAGVQSTSSVRYALEVPKGWFQKNGIKPGDKVEISSLSGL
ncbi:MAG: DUF192 domain-containing protein [Spirochaetia bacterium]|nr:DUF192 domain-containing protein [Spirochaetia bacterium]MDD7697886.1 DUF192 domain-containing protein [Spirochaetia bacterium]MDY4211081.1 DUF192 domain-containing protein [Treponema sp.]